MVVDVPLNRVEGDLEILSLVEVGSAAVPVLHLSFEVDDPPAGAEVPEHPCHLEHGVRVVLQARVLCVPTLGERVCDGGRGMEHARIAHGAEVAAARRDDLL